MISRYTHQGLTWIDLESPTIEEIASLKEEYNLHQIVADELKNPSERAKVDVYPKCIYLILHFPLRTETNGRITETEVDFILLPNVMITTHYELIDPLHDFGRIFETGNYLNHSKDDKNTHEGFLFFYAIRELYAHTMFILESITHQIYDIEGHMFLGKEAAMVEYLSKTNRSIIDIRQSLRYHKETLKSFSYACTQSYGDEFQYYASAIEGEYERIEQITKDNRQTLRELRETNDSLLSSKTNGTIKRLTVVNVVTLPLTLIATIFGMNSKFLFLNDPNMLVAVFGAMVILSLASIVYLKYKKWL